MREAERAVNTHRVSAMGGELLGRARSGDEVAVNLVVEMVEKFSGTMKQFPQGDPAFKGWKWRERRPAWDKPSPWSRRSEKKRT